MKKLLAAILLISFCLTMLVGCDGCAGVYRVEVTGSKDSLMKPLKSFYRAGTVVQIKAHPVTDITLHIYVNGEQIAMTHFDSDYWGYEFVMPAENVTVHLTYDAFYGQTDFTFEDVFYTRDLENNITKVALKATDNSESYPISEKRYSTNQADIDACLAIIENGLVLADHAVLGEGLTWEYEYTFYWQDAHGEERMATMFFYDNFFVWQTFSESRLFRIADENYQLPTIEHPDLVTYSFLYDGRSSDVKSYEDPTLSIRFFGISSVEFVPYVSDGQLEANMEPAFYLDSRYGHINLYTDTIFELDGDFYRVVSGEDYWAWRCCGLRDLEA